MKAFIRILIFVTILCFVFLKFCSVFNFKYGDGIYDMTKFYEQDRNTVDVLILGSSHAFENINTGTLWDEYGMSSFLLCGSIQPMWNTYYYLKEALKTQTPKLIVLEGYCTTFTNNYNDDSRIIKNNFGLRLSPNKIKSLMASTNKRRWPEFFLEYIHYHSRYKEIKKSDFLKNQGYPLYEDWKGFGCNMQTTAMIPMDVSDISERKELAQKTEKYYRAVIELAQKKKIPIIIVVAPYAGINESHQKYFNRASDIASEYNVSFINCNLLFDEIGLDFTTDVADKEHLNYKGTPKLSRYIGKHIKEKYGIPDRRSDEKYVSWQRHADYIRQKYYKGVNVE